MESIVNEPIRILVVEDSSTQAENLRYMLEQQSYNVHVARNGEEALKIMTGISVTIIISDIIMPGMDGFQLCKSVKSDEKKRNIPFILLTALSDPEDVLKGLECGADHFITKPYDEKVLLTKIHDILVNAQMSKQSMSQAEGAFFYKGRRYLITSEQGQVLNLLLSTYELVVMKNRELKEVKEKLETLNDNLEKMVEERTAELAIVNEGLRKEIVEHRIAEEALQQSKKQLRILASQILTAQEEERKRIALEVHDVLGSSLSAIKFKVEEVLYHVPEGQTLDLFKPLEVLIPLIQDTIGEVRRIQSDLRPPVLDDLGIIATISWFCRRFETIYSNIGVHQTITAGEENVPDHLKISLFRIIQEAMNNIGKHAQADRIDLGLQKLGGTLELSIGDNGKGFDPEALSSRESSQKGLGLSSMKERVEFSGGTLTIESATGKGTVLKAVWSI